LNGKIEHPGHTIADIVRALYFNAGHSPDKWCYAAETAAVIYPLTLNSAIGISPYEAWYGIRPRIDDLCVWGCTVYVRTPSSKKSESKFNEDSSWVLPNHVYSLDGSTQQPMKSSMPMLFNLMIIMFP
jgi:hypothetical protein